METNTTQLLQDFRERVIREGAPVIHMGDEIIGYTMIVLGRWEAFDGFGASIKGNLQMQHHAEKAVRDRFDAQFGE